MPVTQLEHQRRQVALVRAVKANDIPRVRRLLKDCRDWDSVYHRSDPHSDRYDCSCCFKSGECISPARDAALRTAIALGLRDLVNLILDAGIQNSPGGRFSQPFESTAVSFEQVDILRLLLERNIFSDPDMELSAVRSAVKKGSFPLTEAFIEYGRVTRSTALKMAIKSGKLELVQALMEVSQPAPTLPVLFHNAQSSAASGHLELVKYFLKLIRHEHDSKVVLQVAARRIYQEATTLPILELCMPLIDEISDDDRSDVLLRALIHGHTNLADFLIRHGVTYDPSFVHLFWQFVNSEAHFLFLWNLLGGTSNLKELTENESHERPHIYGVIQKGFWNALEACLRNPAFKIGKARRSWMIRALNRAIEDEQDKVVWHFIENVPECRPLLLADVKLPFPRSPALIRILSRCRELLMRTKETPALRWEMSTLSDVFFNLISHSKLRLMEAVVAPIGLDAETQTAAVVALRRICLLTMRLMADENQDESLKRDLRHELVTCAALPGCDTISEYFAYNICTEALARHEQVLFAVIRDALTGPSYPDGGFFYAYDHDKLKRNWLAIAAEQGLHDIARSLIPSSPAENLSLQKSNAPSPKCSISKDDKPLWQSAVKRAIDEGDYIILELLRQTQYTFNGHDANELAIILLRPAFNANDHALLRYLRRIGVTYPPLEFSSMFLQPLYHDLNPKQCICALNNHDNASFKDVPAHATMESICIYLGVSDAELDSVAMDANEEEAEGMLFADMTIVQRSDEVTNISCRGSPRIAANYTTLVFNRQGHAMCGGCLKEKLHKAKRARCRDVGGNPWLPDETNNDNIRVGCNTGRKRDGVELIFPVTPSLQRIPPNDAELFLSKDDAYVYFDYRHHVSQPFLRGQLRDMRVGDETVDNDF
ncbi:hypothetical protein DFS34DRAFT_398922 [Phlyctochytrium arcticum]|nr:hypothetical protein DFS34DRAFT_398922 [Phlyctochytrium arcticum]